MYNLTNDVIEVFDQNVGDLNPSGQNMDVSGDTIHNDKLIVEVDELEPSDELDPRDFHLK